MVPLNVRKGSLKGLLVLLSLLLAMAANVFPYGQSYAQSAQPDQTSATDHFNRGEANFDEGLYEAAIAEFDEALRRLPQTISIAERPISTRVCMKQLSQSLMKHSAWFPTSQTRITFDGGRCTR